MAPIWKFGVQCIKPMTDIENILGSDGNMKKFRLESANNPSGDGEEDAMRDIFQVPASP